MVKDRANELFLQWPTSIKSYLVCRMAEIYRPGAIFSVGTRGELWKKAIFDKLLRYCRQDHSR